MKYLIFEREQILFNINPIISNEHIETETSLSTEVEASNHPFLHVKLTWKINIDSTKGWVLKAVYRYLVEVTEFSIDHQDVAVSEVLVAETFRSAQKALNFSAETDIMLPFVKISETANMIVFALKDLDP